MAELPDTRMSAFDEKIFKNKKRLKAYNQKILSKCKHKGKKKKKTQRWRNIILQNKPRLVGPAINPYYFFSSVLDMQGKQVAGEEKM